jgi:hypothetical protein
MHTICIWSLSAQSQDVIHHFAKHGLDATPKLVHCLQALAATDEAPSSPSTAKQETAADADSDIHGPYDLKVVPRAQLPASYYTLTATGVVEVWAQACSSADLAAGQLALHMAALRLWWQHCDCGGS